MIKKINIVLKVIIILGTILFAFIDYSRLLTYLAVIPILLLPKLFVKTRFKLEEIEMLYYLVFIFLAYFLGSVLNLYNLTNYYDTIIHFISGIFTFKIALFIIEKLEIKNLPKSFIILFGITFSCFIAVIWEFFEFFADILLNMNLQRQLTEGVKDTMIDMLSATLGAITISILKRQERK